MIPYICNFYNRNLRDFMQFDPTRNVLNFQDVILTSKKKEGLQCKEKDKSSLALFHYLGKVWRWIWHPSSHMESVYNDMYSKGHAKLMDPNTPWQTAALGAKTLLNNLNSFENNVVNVHNQRRVRLFCWLHLAGVRLSKKEQYVRELQEIVDAKMRQWSAYDFSDETFSGLENALKNYKDSLTADNALVRNKEAVVVKILRSYSAKIDRNNPDYASKNCLASFHNSLSCIFKDGLPLAVTALMTEINGKNDAVWNPRPPAPVNVQPRQDPVPVQPQRKANAPVAAPANAPVALPAVEDKPVDMSPLLDIIGVLNNQGDSNEIIEILNRNGRDPENRAPLSTQIETYIIMPLMERVDENEEGLELVCEHWKQMSEALKLYEARVNAAEKLPQEFLEEKLAAVFEALKAGPAVNEEMFQGLPEAFKLKYFSYLSKENSDVSICEKYVWNLNHGIVDEEVNRQYAAVLSDLRGIQAFAHRCQNADVKKGLELVVKGQELGVNPNDAKMCPTQWDRINPDFERTTCGSKYIYYAPGVIRGHVDNQFKAGIGKYMQVGNDPVVVITPQQATESLRGIQCPSKTDLSLTLTLNRNIEKNVILNMNDCADIVTINDLEKVPEAIFEFVDSWITFMGLTDEDFE